MILSVHSWTWSDDLTPYYQDRMRQLAPAQRKIVEFLCLKGKPTTIKDIATPCLMSQQTAAKQVGELETAGFINRTRVGRNTYCELSEPLMRICIEVKDNKTQHFRLFVEFLRHWFTNREIELGRPADAAAASAAKIEALPGGLLLGRLFATQVAAATEPLPMALDTLGAVVECRDFDIDEEQHLEAVVGILIVSLREFGPRHLAKGWRSSGSCWRIGSKGTSSVAF